MERGQSTIVLNALMFSYSSCSSSFELHNIFLVFLFILLSLRRPQDGFALSFDREIRTEARAEIVKVAAEYKQGAIYEFSVDGDSGVLTRRVIWCDPAKQQEFEDEVTEMESLTTIPESNLAQAIPH